MKNLTDSLPAQDVQDIELLTHLFGLPHKILSHHDLDGLAPMVLHELGHSNGLGLSKAGYLIDNPDFNCLKGVAGYCNSECHHHKEDLWSSPHTFVDDMSNAKFHQQLATFNHHSSARMHHDEVDQGAMEELGRMLGMNNPSCLTWKMKHGNNGILLFEGDEQHLAHRKELLRNVAGLLSLC